MAKVKHIQNSNENYFQKKPKKEESVFNSKLFLNLDLSFEPLNNSFSTESENSEEIEDVNSSSFLPKELIEELNSSSDFLLKNDSPINESQSFLYFLNNNYNMSKNIINNINNNNELLFRDFNPPIIYNYNSNFHIDKSYKKNYYKKRNKIIKDKKRDWVCQLCFNLNYAFRTECNRCKVPKEKCIF